jgi:hypothetical protein
VSVQLRANRLNYRQAVRCENSEYPRCQCRCGGLLHGASRSRLPEFFEQVQATDPHHVPEKSRQLPLPAPVGSP